MNKNEFKKIFLRALDVATHLVEERGDREIPHFFLIELHAPNHVGSLVSIDEAIDIIFLGEDCFYKIIDVAIKAIQNEQSIVFVRVSGHAPVEFKNTWNANELGPFKLIEFQGELGIPGT